MRWLSLVAEVDAAAAEPLADALLARGAASVAIEDAAAGTPAEEAVFESTAASGVRWMRARLRALLPEGSDAPALLRAAAAEIGLRSPPAFALEPVAADDWVRHAQSQFEPIRISARIWVVPSWHAPPEPEAINLLLDPGLAFGTGSHPTTRACLRWLEQRVAPGTRVLDYGCGSGILAIAAAKLGAGETLGVDIDPDALAAARENAVRNRVAVRFLDPGLPLAFAADLVVANILANPLKLLAPLLAARCRRAGRIAVAGILESQAVDVAAAYAPWFEMAEWDREEGWIALEGMRR